MTLVIPQEAYLSYGRRYVLFAVVVVEVSLFEMVESLVGVDFLFKLVLDR